LPPLWPVTGRLKLPGDRATITPAGEDAASRGRGSTRAGSTSSGSAAKGTWVEKAPRARRWAGRAPRGGPPGRRRSARAPEPPPSPRSRPAAGLAAPARHAPGGGRPSGEPAWSGRRRPSQRRPRTGPGGRGRASHPDNGVGLGRPPERCQGPPTAPRRQRRRGTRGRGVGSRDGRSVAMDRSNVSSTRAAVLDALGHRPWSRIFSRTVRRSRAPVAELVIFSAIQRRARLHGSLGLLGRIPGLPRALPLVRDGGPNVCEYRFERVARVSAV
jgi:hypothetical protein